jgi:type I restriction enzyme S subunit
MAKYQKYAEYKDSGVEWLGEIPSHWNVSKIGFHTSKIGSGKTPKGGAEVYKDEGILFLRSQNIYNDGLKIDASESVYITQAIHDDMSTSKVDPGDILLNITGGSIGRSCLVPPSYPEANVNQHVCIIRVRNPLNKFLAQVIKADLIQAQIRLIQTGGNREGLNFEQISKFVFILPPSEEQQLIIKFLDHETAKIDTLITKQEKLIELLKEKRQAVISHAVTKGLNSNVPMKDSGVEWLGEVPEHWKLVPLKYLCSFSGGGTPTKDNLTYWTNGNIPWVSPKDMKTFWVKETQDYITEKAVKESSTNMVEPNSLLMVVRSGILQRTIPIAINIVPVTMNQDMKALKFGKRILVEYVANLIHGNTQQLLLEWSKEGATVESIEHEYLANSVIPVPSIEEQDLIVKLIAKKMSIYRELTEKAELQISLLQERRTALISAAVTGKIDVRNWQHPNQKNNNNTELSA